MVAACRNLNVSTIGNRANRSTKEPQPGLDTSSESNDRKHHDVVMERVTKVALRKLECHSDFFDQNPPAILPSFSSSDIDLGVVVGRGEFGVVIQVISLPQSEVISLPQSASSSSSPSSSSSSLTPRMKLEHEIHHDATDAKTSSAPDSSCVPKVVSASSDQNDCDNDDPALTAHAGDDHTKTTANTTNKSQIDDHQTSEKKHQQKNVASDRQRRYVSRLSSVSFAEDVKLPEGDQSTISTDLEEDFVIQNVESLDEPDLTGMKLKMVVDDDDSDQFEGDLVDGEAEFIRSFMSSHCIRNGIPRYVIKRLRSDLEPTLQIHAASDLACEAKFLASINHPNIVKMRGTVGKPGTSDFMVIMDALVSTLRQKMTEWNEVDANSKPNILFPCFASAQEKLRFKTKQQDIFGDKLLAVYDIARAMKYLHSHSIVFRDIKPDNIGFDLRGEMRLFDFGLAKELRWQDLISKPDSYLATGLTGSRRYMAPEVVLCKDYGLSVDVYSYAVLIWEVFSGKVAFQHMTVDNHVETVVIKGKRPPKQALQRNRFIYPKFPKQLEQLIIDSWSADPQHRPSFRSICRQLSDQAEMSRCGDHISDRTLYLSNQSIRSRCESAQSLDLTM